MPIYEYHCADCKRRVSLFYQTFSAAGAAIPITPAEETIAANARVSGSAWVRVWLPALLEGRDLAPLRVAPVSHSGQLFGLLVAERARKDESRAAEADVTLEEVVEHTRAIDAATSLPVSVDLENGYGPDPKDAARAISRSIRKSNAFSTSGRLNVIVARGGAFS